MARVGNVVGGKYRLVESIGEGSMGNVWKALHDDLGRPFAVKFLKQYEGNTAELEDRFLVEARLAAAVHHRFVVDVVDVGRTDEGTPFMVMEHLEGVSLAKRLQDGPCLKVSELLQIMQQALLGLAAVHRAGIVHRDFKPENIVLCSDGGGAKLVDFGISRQLSLLGVPDVGSARLTRPGTAVGTPLYMAPEQTLGLSTVDWRSDIYAAGVILYECLAGRPPYDHEDPHTLMALALDGGAPPLMFWRPDLPAQLSDLVARAMAVEPDARFVSAAEMAAALHAIEVSLCAESTCGPLGQPTPATATMKVRARTLPRRFARMGSAAMPSRRILVATSLTAIAGTLALYVFLRSGGGVAAAHPPAAILVDPARVTVGEPASTRSLSELGGKQRLDRLSLSMRSPPAPAKRTGEPSRARRASRAALARPPELFRTPGF